MSVVFEAGKVDAKGLIAHFNDSTDFTLAQIETLSDGEAPDVRGLDVLTVSEKGERFDLKASLAKGKVTIIDFGADWCVPCKVLEKRLVAYMRENEGIALRKVDIVNFESDVAKQHLQGVEGIPFVIIYDESGRELYRGAGLIDEIKRMLPTGD